MNALDANWVTKDLTLTYKVIRGFNPGWEETRDKISSVVS